MSENYYALAVSIILGYTPEQAFEIMDTGKLSRKSNPGREETLDMIRLKSQGYTYKQIGELYSISPDAVHSRIRRTTERIRGGTIYAVGASKVS